MSIACMLWWQQWSDLPVNGPCCTVSGLQCNTDCTCAPHWHMFDRWSLFLGVCPQHSPSMFECCEWMIRLVVQALVKMKWIFSILACRWPWNKASLRYRRMLMLIHLYSTVRDQLCFMMKYSNMQCRNIRHSLQLFYTDPPYMMAFYSLHSCVNVHMCTAIELLFVYPCHCRLQPGTRSLLLRNE